MVLQSKFLARPRGTSPDHDWLIRTVESELKLWESDTSARKQANDVPDYLVIAMNVVLSPVSGGGIDRLDAHLKARTQALGIKAGSSGITTRSAGCSTNHETFVPRTAPSSLAETSSRSCTRSSTATPPLPVDNRWDEIVDGKTHASMASTGLGLGSTLASRPMKWGTIRLRRRCPVDGPDESCAETKVPPRAQVYSRCPEAASHCGADRRSGQLVVRRRRGHPSLAWRAPTRPALLGARPPDFDQADGR